MDIQINNLWPLRELQEPYLNVVAMGRYVCSDSVLVVYTCQNGFRWAVLTPFN